LARLRQNMSSYALLKRVKSENPEMYLYDDGPEPNVEKWQLDRMAAEKLGANDPKA
jgi:hypothetical protein